MATPPPPGTAIKAKRPMSEAHRQKIKEGWARRRAERAGADASPAAVAAPIAMPFETKPRARRGDTTTINPMRLVARDDTPTLVDPLSGVR